MGWGFPYPIGMTNSEDKDPTAYELGGTRYGRDPRVVRISGWSNHGSMRIDMPFITEVTDDLWHGGVETGLTLPDIFDYKLSLYKWEDYEINHPMKETLTVTMLDSIDQEMDGIFELAQWVNERRKKGRVLVHCQAGINRSSVVIATALFLNGDVRTGQEAIDLLRAKRTPAVLVNPAFEAWVQRLGVDPTLVPEEASAAGE